MSLKDKLREAFDHWKLLVIFAVVGFGVYLGGVTTGYFTARAEYAHQIAVMQAQLEQIPQRTADKVQRAVTEEEKSDEHQRQRH